MIMKVDNPKFNSDNPMGTCWCSECPFGDGTGPFNLLCSTWGYDHSPCCPTAENYAEACALAEAV